MSWEESPPKLPLMKCVENFLSEAFRTAAALVALGRDANVLLLFSVIFVLPEDQSGFGKCEFTVP